MTCILGAGATIPVGGPTTAALTDAVCKTMQTTRHPITGEWRQVAFLKEVADRLNGFLSPRLCNFEDILHVLETLDSYRTGWRSTTAPSYRPRPAAFLSPRDLKWFDQLALQSGKEELVRAVAQEVAKSVSLYNPGGHYHWFRAFWTDAFSRANWDMATLNYDDLFERTAVDFEDGYQRVGDPTAFEPDLVWKETPVRILHLHGSILFGYPVPPPTGVWQPSFNDLWKFPETASAQKTWFDRSWHTSQANEEVVTGPIITGLRKPDKLTVQPYGEYQDVLGAAIRESPRLLVIGYSFGDLYLNDILRRHPGRHKTRRRVVFVTRFGDPQQWHCDPRVLSGEWLTTPMREFMAEAMHSSEPLGSSLTYSEVLCSKDGCCRIHLGGTEAALQNYSNEILEFLTAP